MELLLEIILWSSLGVSGFAYGGYTLVGRLLPGRRGLEGERR